MGLFDKFRKGLKKTRDQGLTAQMDEVIESHEEITDELFDELEEVLIMGDVGMPTAERVIGDLKAKIANDKITSVSQVRETMKDIVAGVVWGGSYLRLRTKPSIILVIGVNGVGKTTTIGKLALRLKSMGRSVILGAADTFRAAAIEQLQVWADRADVPIIKHGEGADPAAVVYDTIQAGKARNSDVIIIDTAGRLHNKKNLMDELNKISRVIDRELPNASRETLLVLDATTGQNAVNQAKDFKEAAGITGIILTKLDGTARGGVVLAINNELDVPVKFVGVGEQIDDLQPFDAEAFASALFEHSRFYFVSRKRRGQQEIMDFILASNNKKKLEEMQRILSPLGINVVTAKMLGIALPDVVEDGDTFEQNAEIKARSACEITGMPAIADDSGLCVDCLDGAPGIYSARFANIIEHNGVNVDNEKNADDEANNDMLLSKLEGVPEEKRTAYYVCAICCIFPDGKKIVVRGECHGKIGFARDGNEGFGYDPLFIIGGKSFGKYTGEEKDKISHRGNALRKLSKELEKII